MTESAAQPAKPPRTWRPMAAWTGALLLALGLIWFVAAVVVPAWQTRTIVREYRQDTHSWSLLLPSQGMVYPRDWDDLSRRPSALGAIARLGGPKSAKVRLSFYLRMPDGWSTEKVPAVEMLWYCGAQATPQLERLLSHRDADVRAAAAEALKQIRGEGGSAPEPSNADVVHRSVCSKCGHVSTVDAGCPRAIWEHCPHKDASAAKRVLDGLASGHKKDKAEYRAVESVWGPPQWRGPGDGPWSGCTQVQYRVYDGVYNFMIDGTGHVVNYELAEGVGEYECPKCGGAWKRE